MMRKLCVLCMALGLLLLAVPVKADLIKVDDFESYAVDTFMDSQTSPGELGGTWDADAELGVVFHTQRSGKVAADPADAGNQVIRQEYRNGSFRALAVYDLADPIGNGETGVLFFRFYTINSGTLDGWSMGAHDLTGTDPIPDQQTDYKGSINAGFTLKGNASALNITTVDGTETLMTGLANEQWYAAWIVIDNSADTFDLYIEEASAAAGDAALPTSEPVAVGLPFDVATDNPLTGALFAIDGASGNSNYVDEIWWSGSGGLIKKGAAHTPTPENGASVDSTVVNQLTWMAPEDPNLVSVDQYDLTIYSKLTGDLTGDDPNFLTNGVTYTDVTSPYAITLDYDTTYFWRVDTHVTWDSNDFTGTADTTALVEGSIWKFSSIPEYLAPVLEDYENVITTIDLVPASLSATVSGNSDSITSVVFTLLDTDVEYPAGATVTFTNTTVDNQNPTATLDTDTPGLYKVKLEISDGVTTLEQIAEINVYADACQAQKDAPSGWTANYYDRDGNCIVDLLDFAVLAQAWLNDTSMDAQENYTGDVSFIPQAIYDARFEAETYDPNNPDPNTVSAWPITDTTGIRVNDDTNAIGGQKALGFTGDGAFIEYEISELIIPAAGTYDLYVMTSGNAPASVPTVLNFGTAETPDLYGSIGPFPVTGWADYYLTQGELTFPAAGPITVRVTWVGGSANLDFFTLVQQ